MTGQNQLQIYSSIKSLLDAADTQANSVSSEFQESTKLYFIARYFVAIYESRHGKVPIQVWNEYRNALDHFFRYLTNAGALTSSDDIHHNLHKMEGHIQRAALDILKLLCHKTQDSVSQKKSEYSIEVLKLVGDAKFFPWLNKSMSEAERLYEHAKISDLQLGKDIDTNAGVLNAYLEATFAFDKIQRELINKSEDCSAAQENHKNIASDAKNLSLRTQLIIGFGIAIIMYIIGNIYSAKDLINYNSNATTITEKHTKQAPEHKVKPEIIKTSPKEKTNKSIQPVKDSLPLQK